MNISSVTVATMMNLRNRTLEFLIALTAIVFVVMVIFNALGGAGYIGTVILNSALDR